LHHAVPDAAASCGYRVGYFVGDQPGFLDAPEVRFGDAVVGEQG
jgi:hypothetical protein